MGKSLTITVYLRQVFLPTEGSPTPLFVRPHEGRWGTRWTLHTALTPATAWAEYCRNFPDLVEQADPTGGLGVGASVLRAIGDVELGDPVLKRGLFELTFEFGRALDIESEAVVLTEAGFGSGEIYADDYGLCPELARWAAGEGFEAIIAPSAAWRHADGGVCAVLEPGRSLLIDKTLTVPAARPTISVAVGTTYKAGTRPSWV